MPELSQTLDAREPAADAALGALPEWDLTDLYAAPDAPELARDLDWLRAECLAFAADYEGRLAGLDAAGLLAAIRRYERIETRLRADQAATPACATTRTPPTRCGRSSSATCRPRSPTPRRRWSSSRWS